MMRKSAIIVILAALTAAGAVSCDKKRLATTYDRQEENIQSIARSLSSSGDDVSTEYLKGSVRVTLSQGEGAALEPGGTVSFYYAGFYITSSSLSTGNLFATNNEAFAKSVGWNLSDSSAFEVRSVNLSKDDLVEGLRNGLVGVKGGDECYVMFSGKHGFGKKTVGGVPSRAALAYHLWIEGVTNNN